jgi:hypothetical protein
VDFDLRPIDKGGNADLATFSPLKTLANPNAFIGKSVRIPGELQCLSFDIAGIGSDGKAKPFDGVACLIGGGGQLAITGDLKVRDTMKNKVIKEVIGTIVGVSEVHKIIVKPTEIITK